MDASASEISSAMMLPPGPDPGEGTADRDRPASRANLRAKGEAIIREVELEGVLAGVTAAGEEAAGAAGMVDGAEGGGTGALAGGEAGAADDAATYDLKAATSSSSLTVTIMGWPT